ncbi:hypothetical protein EDD68_1102 [Melghiribacillus thermohalophilus]|uniref:Bacteriocin-associated integral membrane protein n=1 Tax=Melghiribacillus thermohalophilus TaxID=1324956 RepID=A0A4R3MYG0_9BACI|nr:hypothetical protein [Melghiribacillus thermohalophilus]TCT21698.1 hypothetical protein EDD68_1102 [Melghiribacillus thermohalophilus]
MKKIKYIIIFCIFFIGMLIIGESHIFKLNNFYTEFDNTTLYLQPDTTDNEMKKDILKSAKENKVEVFTIKNTPRSTFQTEIHVYGTTKAIDYINNNLNITDRTYNSLFMGSVIFHFHSLNDIPDMSNTHEYYVIGSNKQVHEFKMDLINKYAGNHPNEGYASKELRNTAIAIWILIILITFMLTYYDSILQKKENMIRISFGERISKIIIQNILFDTSAIIICFLLVMYILSNVTFVFFMFNISIIGLVILIILNGLIYLNLYFYDLKETFSNVKGSRKLLSLNYTLKFIAAIIVPLIIASNIALIFDSYSLYRQKDFFEKHADYYYTKLEYKPLMTEDGEIVDTLGSSADIQVEFYQKFFYEFDATLIADISNIIDYDSIIANKNAFDYLSNHIDELQGIKLIKDFYFLIPNNMKQNNRIISEVHEAVMHYYGRDFKYEYEIIYYDKNQELISIDENSKYGSKLVENPIIVYDNMTPAEFQKIQSNNIVNIAKTNFLHDIMYNLSEDKFNRFVEENDLTGQIVTKTNVLEKYAYNWAIAKRILYMNFVFSILILSLEVIIISSIIRLEYDVNAVELSIKKVFGHSKWGRYRKITIVTIATSLMSIIAVLLIGVLMGIGHLLYIVLGGFMILFLELLLIMYNIKKIEKAKIVRVLKGGNL